MTDKITQTKLRLGFVTQSKPARDSGVTNEELEKLLAPAHETEKPRPKPSRLRNRNRKKTVLRRGIN
ncbi:MAG: hypothetical protein HQ583_02520 [Candidatus Abyssubacteria bacterium]|nr:hypothetical protein [Candidatus Abyssubacteria bacterium]